MENQREVTRHKLQMHLSLNNAFSKLEVRKPVYRYVIPSKIVLPITCDLPVPCLSPFSWSRSNSRTCAHRGFQFPVGRIHRYLKQRTQHNVRIGAKAAVYTSAILEYLTAEVLELAGTCPPDAIGCD